MNLKRLNKKPRVKKIYKDRQFWCFYHKRFFDEEKKFNHCIPKGCFEFDRDHYLWQVEINSEDSVVKAIKEVNTMKKRIVIKLTDFQKELIKKAVGKDVREIMIKQENLYYLKGYGKGLCRQGEGIRVIALQATGVE